ncbi:MAG: immunoglobulin domain-containing protein [Opitutaceae bacterium]
MTSNLSRSRALLLRFAGLLLLALPLTSRALTASAAPGQAITFTVTAEGDQPFSYRWFKDGSELPGATAAEHLVASATLADAGTYVAEVRNAVGATLSDPAVLTVAPVETAPVITTQPASQTVFAGTAVTFTGAASGYPSPAYQWLKDGSPLPGATAGTLNLPAAALTDAGTYVLTATNSVGTATSAPAVLTVNPPLTAPVFTLPPVSQNVTEGAGVGFTAAASGNPAPVLQWYQDGVPIAGATGGTYGIANAVAGSAGAYHVVAQNSAGSTTSATALLTVSPGAAAPVITTQPVSQTVPAGASVTFTVAATGNPAPSYRWFVQVKSGRTLTKTYLPNATSPSLTLSPVATTDAGTYAVDVANSAGTVTSAGAVLKVTTTPSKGPKSQTKLLSGTTIATDLPGRFADTLRADFNGDRSADLVFQQLTSGAAKAWLLSDAARPAELMLSSPAKAWRLATAADFNGDGRADLVWQHAAGTTAEIQLLAGSARLGTVSLSEIPASWQLAAAGDFTGDALPDLVFQDGATGERTVLALTGLQADGLRSLGSLPVEWDIAGAGDFNADGSTDLLLQNLLTGECQLWLLRGTASLARISLGRPGPLWEPAGATDLNGDGRSDILWEHPVTGERLAWLMPAAGAPVALPLGRENPGWILAH